MTKTKTKTKTIELAQAAGIYQIERFDSFGGSNQLERFAELVRTDERARLMEVAVEPVGTVYVNYQGPWASLKGNAKEGSNLYTADQVAAAVLKERAHWEAWESTSHERTQKDVNSTHTLTDEQMKAIVICFTSRRVSISEVQRKMGISFDKARKICLSIAQLCEGLEVSPQIEIRVRGEG